MTQMLPSLWLACCAGAVSLLVNAEASAQTAPPSVADVASADAREAKPRRDVRNELPIAAFAYAAQGAPKSAVGAQGFVLGLAAPGQRSLLGGGASVWGAPMQRLTLIGDAQRNAWGNFSPSVAGTFHLLGERRQGWSLGGLGKLKVDGFASGPNKDELETELELGALISFAELGGFRLDLNLIAGRGLGDDGETDAETRLRFGRELGDLFWLGLDGQARLRVSGPRYLPNGGTWDFALGPQILVGSGSFFALLSAGPATMGLLSSNVGFSSVLGIGGTT
jgi:hypothetical protein